VDNEINEELMANHKSAAKRMRQTERRTAVNRNRVSRVRTYVRKVEEAIKAGDQKVAAEALKACQPELMKAATKGVVKKNTAARKVARFAQRIKKLAS
jgi:small subunit ribosomal protein S20